MSPEEKQIAEHGKATGKTAQQVAVAIAKYRMQSNKPIAASSNQYSFGEAFGDIKEGVAGAGRSMWDAGQSIVNRVTNKDPNISTAQNIVGGGADVFKGIAGVIGNAYGTGMKLAVPQGVEDAAAQGMQQVGEAVASSDIAQDVMKKYQSLDPETKAGVDNVLGYLEGITSIVAPGQAKQIAATIIENASKRVATSSIRTGAEKVAGIVGQDARKSFAESTMGRVARVNPTDARKFKQSTGKEIGEYLVERGIYGNDEQIMEQLYKETIRSKKEADDALATIGGTWRHDSVKSALKLLIENEEIVSSPGARSKILDQAIRLYKKHHEAGLTMTEINEAKRLFEQNVRVDYLKSAAFRPTDLKKANNIDNGIRAFQFDIAKKMGLKNLPEINKNTQSSRMLGDALYKKAIGQAGNNAFSLTDAVLVSGGNVSGLLMGLTRKILGSKTVQSKIAKAVGPNAVKPQVNAQFRDPITDESRLLAPGENVSAINQGRAIPVRPKPYGNETDFVGKETTAGRSTKSTQQTERTQSSQSKQSSPTSKAQQPKQSTPLSTKARQPAQKTSSPKTTTKPVNVAKQELKRQIEGLRFMEEMLNESRIKPFVNKVGKGDYSLAQLQENAIKRNAKNKGNAAKYYKGKENINRYDNIDELGFKDLDEAQAALDQYMKDKEKIKMQKAYIKDLREKIKNGEDVETYDDPRYYAETERGMINPSAIATDLKSAAKKIKDWWNEPTDIDLSGVVEAAKPRHGAKGDPRGMINFFGGKKRGALQAYIDNIKSLEDVLYLARQNRTIGKATTRDVQTAQKNLEAARDNLNKYKKEHGIK